MKPSISVVVPAYNVEKYIKQCLNSILNQTFSDWECVIVNDGSTDNTLSIIESFKKEDSRFSCITTPNSGASKTARDVAIANAQSDWIVPVDADDYIESNHLEKLLFRAQETDADIVCARMKLFDDNNPNYSQLVPAMEFDMSSIISGKQAMMLTIPWQIGGNGSLFKCKLHTSLSTFQKGLNSLNVDEYDTRELMISARKVAFADCVYHYRQLSNSLSKGLSIKAFHSLIVDKKIEELGRKHFGENSPEIKKIQNYRIKQLIDKHILFLKKRKKFSIEDRKKGKKLLKESYNNINKKHLYEDKRIRKILFLNGYNLFVISIFFIHIIVGPTLVKCKLRKAY